MCSMCSKATLSVQKIQKSLEFFNRIKIYWFFLWIVVFLIHFTHILVHCVGQAFSCPHNINSAIVNQPIKTFSTGICTTVAVPGALGTNMVTKRFHEFMSD